MIFGQNDSPGGLKRWCAESVSHRVNFVGFEELRSILLHGVARCDESKDSHDESVGSLCNGRFIGYISKV